MSHEVKTVICGLPHNIEDTELCLPLPNKFLYSPTKIKSYIESQPKSVFFIIVLLNLFGQTIESILIEIGNRDNIIGIFVCVNHIYNLATNQTDVFHLSKRLLTYKTTACAIRSYEAASKRLYQTSLQGLAYVLEQTSNNLKRWLTINVKVRACDVLIIPLNTNDANLYDFQQRIIELCEGLCHDYEPRVLTLHDYISPDEISSNMSKEDQAFMNEQNTTICSLIKKLACIRIYVVGNDDGISNNYSKLMIENEPDNPNQKEPQYDQWCTFVENEPINIENIHNLLHRYGRSWQVTNINPIRLNKIRDDIHFLYALDQSHITLEAREMIANVELSLWAMNYHENTSCYSSEFQMIDEAQSVIMETDSNGTGEMNNTIRYYRRSPSNDDNNNPG